MGLLNFFETHIVGSDARTEVTKKRDDGGLSGSKGVEIFGSWSLVELLNVLSCLSQLLLYIYLHYSLEAVLHVSNWVLTSHVSLQLIALHERFWLHIPVIGTYPISTTKYLVRYLEATMVPGFQNTIKVVDTCYQLYLVQCVFQNRERVEILFTADSHQLEFLKDGNLLTTLVLANHRSINDYALISYILQNACRAIPNEIRRRDLLKLMWNVEPPRDKNYAKIGFVGWGDIFNFLSWRLVRNVLTRTENHAVSSQEIEKALRENGNRILVMFPEVNILTAELGIVQRKLNQSYSTLVTKYYNVLYPRFKTFVNTINCIASLANVERNGRRKQSGKRRHLGMLRARLFKSQITNQQSILGAKVLGKILRDSEEGKGKGKGQRQQQLDPLLLATFSTATTTTAIASNFNNGSNTTSPVRLNRYIYDFTLVYYRPRSVAATTTTTTTTSQNHSHDRETSNLRLHNDTQLKQVVPSLLDLFHNRGKPLFVVVDVARYPVADLLQLSDSKLEKWLEQQWIYKDRVISRNSHSFAGIVTG